MPEIRQYPQATSLLSTDAFIIDRLTQGTMYIQGLGIRAITYVVDGGGSVINTGVVGDLYIPFTYNITTATLLADQSGSVSVDIWSAPYANYPPTVANSIVAGAPLTLTSATHSQNTTLTGWTTTITAGNTLRYNINSAATITRLTITLS